MSRRVWIVAALAVLAAAAPARADAVRIAAIVNDAVITDADVAAGMDEVRAEFEPGRDDALVRRAALQQLIQRRLILQEAARSGVTVSAAALDGRLDELRARFPSEDAFQQSLKDSGMTVERLKEQLREQLLAQQMIDRAVRAEITVSPQEIAQQAAAHPEEAPSGDRVHALHILIRVGDEHAAGEAKKLIQDIARKAQEGADFSQLSRRYSEDAHRDAGGDMGWVAKGELMPELDSALFALSPGAVSPPIQTRLGYHLVKVLDRRTSASLSAKDAYQAVFQRIYQEKFERAFQQWITQLGRKAYIEILES